MATTRKAKAKKAVKKAPVKKKAKAAKPKKAPKKTLEDIYAQNELIKAQNELILTTLDTISLGIESAYQAAHDTKMAVAKKKILGLF